MCGRFTLRTPKTVLIEHFQLGLEAARQLALFEPRYNIAPTQDILAVRAEPHSGEREAALLRWGLIPSWTKELQVRSPMINARGETIADKPSFRTATRRRRCLIPAGGFYAWQKTAGSTKKRPYYIHYRDNRPFALAGLSESWTAKSTTAKSTAGNDTPIEDALTIESCTIVTTSACKALTALYDRMPVILEPGTTNSGSTPTCRTPPRSGT